MTARILQGIGLVLVLCPLRGFAQQANPPKAWSYTGPQGPAHWGTLNTDYAACKTGRHQSPIDIQHETPADLPAIQFSYVPAPLRILDNGHTIEVVVAPGSFIQVGEQKYELQQFHFHHPAEERIRGRSFPLVAHLVHKGTDGKLAVVAVLFKTGTENPFLQTLWKSMPADVNQEHEVEGVSIDPTQLLPADRGYYTFTGSLTTPPCSEGVTWFVLKNPAELSSADLAAFAKKYAHNARPIQPLNGRPIKATR
jgi:carbonic anhydrase